VAKAVRICWALSLGESDQTTRRVKGTAEGGRDAIGVFMPLCCTDCWCRGFVRHRHDAERIYRSCARTTGHGQDPEPRRAIDAVYHLADLIQAEPQCHRQTGSAQAAPGALKNQTHRRRRRRTPPIHPISAPTNTVPAPIDGLGFSRMVLPPTRRESDEAREHDRKKNGVQMNKAIDVDGPSNWTLVYPAEWRGSPAERGARGLPCSIRRGLTRFNAARRSPDDDCLSCLEQTRGLRKCAAVQSFGIQTVFSVSPPFKRTGSSETDELARFPATEPDDYERAARNRQAR
jgi:hypothetical protein